MANFCAKCGAQTGGVAFCPQCGSPQDASQPAAPPPQTPVAPPIPAPVKKGGGAFKILIVVLLFLGFFIVLAGAGIWYAAHRIKQAVVAKAHTYGIEMSDSDHRNTRLNIQVCEFLPKETVSTILELPIDHTETQSHGCMYFGPAGLSEKLAKNEMHSLVNNRQTGNKEIDGSQVADAVSHLAANFGKVANGVPMQSEGPLLTVIIDGDGKTQMTALSATAALASGFKGASSEVPNLGDRALRLGNLGLNVLKDDTIIRIVPGPVPNGREKSILIAREVLPKV